MAMATTILRTMLLKSFGALLFIGSLDGCNPKRILSFTVSEPRRLASRPILLAHPLDALVRGLFVTAADVVFDHLG